ncbi:MAG: TerB family tellurite resistance protein [Rikenellaceae bacterium]|nr:TerB family tellurite resistance protein [Rikenellaceae bacterium]
MGLIDKAKFGAVVSSVKRGVTTLVQSKGKEADTNQEVLEGELTPEQVEKGSKMLQIMDWAFDKANGNIPGFGTSYEMAQKYLEKYGNVSDAINHLVKWQITSASTAGFVTSLGGLATMPITLPANIAGVMAIQMRMIGAIAELGGWHENTVEKKTGMYLCLLGSQAGSALSKFSGQFAIKFATASLKKLPGTVLTKINQAVGFRLVTKFGEKGLVNINKAIPILGGLVGGTVEAFSTYGIAQAAKAMFLNDIIDFEKQEQMEIAKIRLGINLALVDNHYLDEEKDTLKILLGAVNISESAKDKLILEIENPKRQKIDLKPFKDDAMNTASLLEGLMRIAKSDGEMTLSEQLYLHSIAKEIGAEDMIAMLQ